MDHMIKTMVEEYAHIDNNSWIYIF